MGLTGRIHFQPFPESHTRSAAIPGNRPEDAEIAIFKPRDFFSPGLVGHSGFSLQKSRGNLVWQILEEEFGCPFQVPVRGHDAADS